MINVNLINISNNKTFNLHDGRKENIIFDNK